MNDKEIELLNILHIESEWISSFDLSKRLHVSKRSIINYINDINHLYDNLILTSKLGYMIQNRVKLKSILEEALNNTIPQNQKQREKVIFKKFLLDTNEYNLNLLSEELSITLSTLNKELYLIKKKFSSFNLNLKIRNEIASLEGSERDKKYMISQMILDESKDGLLSKNLIQTYLPTINIDRIDEIVSHKLQAHQIVMDEFSRKNFILHLAIMISRKSVYLDKSEKELHTKIEISQKLYEIIEQITQKIDKEFKVHFTENDQHDLLLLIMTRIKTNTIDDLTDVRVDDIFGETLDKIVSLIQRKVYDTYFFSLDKSEFKLRLSLHLKNMFIRIENSINLRNPQLDKIKNEYPFIYDISVFIADLILKETQIHLSEDEIAYIAMHIGVEIEEQKSLLNRINVLILNPFPLIQQDLFKSKLNSCFNDQLYIEGFISDPSDISKYANIDLIISTTKITQSISIPWVEVSDYLTLDDTILIKKKFDEIINQRVQNNIIDKLKILFDQRCFWVNKPFITDKETIEYMSDHLVQYGFVYQDYKQKLFDREAISSSSFKNIAIPHPLEMDAKESIIAVLINHNPIQWGSNEVNLVFMLAINDIDRILFKDIFEYITRIVSDEKNLQNLLEVENYDAFLHLLASYT